MPKATKNIPGFTGGEITKFNPRDIPDEALSKAQDVMLDKPGLIRLMGKNETLLVDNTEESMDANITPGYGLYSFRADKHIRLEGTITETATYTFSGAAYTKVTCETPHKFATGSSGAGAEIYIYGMSGGGATVRTNFLRKHKILTVVDSTNFVIDLLWSDLGASYTAKWVWNPGPWGGRPYVNEEGNYCNEEAKDGSITGEFSWCSETNNPVYSEPIDGTFLYITLQDEHAINIYHYVYNVVILAPLVLTNTGASNISHNMVKPDMIYIANALRVSDGRIEQNVNNNKVKWFGYTPPRNPFVKVIDTAEEKGPINSDIKTNGDWNVYNGAKGDIPGILDTSDRGYVESFLKKPKDLGRTYLGSEQNATFFDYSGLQFQVSQYKTRDGSDPDAIGGLSSLLNGTGNPGNSGSNVAEPFSEKPAANINQAYVNQQNTDENEIFRYIFPKHPRQIHMIVSADTYEAGDWQGDAEHAKLKFGMAWVYGTKTMYQESKIYRNKLVTIKSTNAPQNNGPGDTDDETAPAFTANMTFRFEFFVNNGGDSNNNAWINPIKYDSLINDWGDPRLIGASIYITEDGDGELDDPLYLGTVYTDRSEGFIDSYGNKFSWRASWSNGENVSYIGTNGGYGDLWNGDAEGYENDHTDPAADNNDTAVGCALRRVPTLTYKLRNWGLEPYDDDQGQQARWKTSVFAQNRLFVGNVQLLDGINKFVKYPDRMLISPEVKYDIMPHDSYIDVQTNDGDSIVKLEFYKGKLLQFKRNVLYIIDVSGEFYFNEATHMYIGIKNPWSSAVTPGGIVWCNPTGLFVYDGKQIVNVIEQKISKDEWYNFNQGSESMTSPMVSYIPKDKQILISRSPENNSGEGDPGDMWIYDVETESFTFGRKRLSSHTKSNFTASFNDKSLYGVSGSAYEENPAVDGTTPGVYPNYAKGVFFFDGGDTGGNACTFQYYKGDSSWTSFSNAIKFGSNWNSTNTTAGALAARIEGVIGTTPDTAVGDLYISKIEYDINSMWIELTSVASGTAYNSGDGDGTSTGNNSFKLTGVGTDWTTTHDYDAPLPDFGTTNGVSGWITINHMAGGTSGTAQVNTVTINRGGATTTGVSYKMNLKIYQHQSDIEHNLIYKNFDMSYTTTSSDNSDNNLASSLVNVLRGIQEENESGNLGDENADALSYVTIGNASSGAFTITSSDADYKFSFIVEVSGNITLEQFNSNSSSCRNLLIHTKEFDFDEPNVRKKVYKLYMTYKANDVSANSGSLSNVRVYYAVNGSTTFHAMKTKGASDAAGTATNIASSTSFTQAELIPNPTSSANKPNKVYSIKFKICSEPTSGGTGQTVDGFELNDISIIYRVKSIK